MQIVVTSGWRYTESDLLACSIAYTELLKSEGKDASTILPGVLNKSITKDIQKWNLDFKKDLRNKDVKFVVVDVSNPEYFAKFVEENKIIEICDHHTGFENYWKNKLGKKSKIEMIGACATLIWEEFERRNKGKISKTSANLLYTAIISNTLNLNAQITHKRDIVALNKLKKLTSLPKNWTEKYFTDQDKSVYENPIEEIINDTHTENIPQFRGNIIIGQLELWNSKKFIKKHTPEIERALKSFGKPVWFMTSPSISEGINYIYTKNGEIKKLLTKSIGAKFKGNLGTTKTLWLRKEILKKLNETG
jgi:inorganic pyrophosphatase/exopolyphosphatase